MKAKKKTNFKKMSLTSSKKISLGSLVGSKKISLKRKRLFIYVFLFSLIFILPFLIIKFVSGWRLDLDQKTLRPTGLLVATSKPDGAQLWLDNKLKTATDDTLNLTPGKYEVEIKKDGFTSWKKTLTIKKEVVTETDAYLFAAYSNLKALTFTGARQPLLSPDNQKVAYSVATASANKKGLWVLDLDNLPLGLNREPRQVLASTLTKDFAKAEYQWSPDSKQLLITLYQQNFLIEADRLNQTNSLIDITPNLKLIFERWEKEKQLRAEARISKLPKKLLAVIDGKVANIQFSPDENKILYTATASAQIPEGIMPPLPGASTQKQERNLKPNQSYIFDLKEDRNFKLTQENSTTKISWFPTSRHLLLVQKEKISLIEYDQTNLTDIYTGPFEDQFAFPFPAGDRLLILTAIGQDKPPNLYSLSLR